MAARTNTTKTTTTTRDKVVYRAPKTPDERRVARFLVNENEDGSVTRRYVMPRSETDATASFLSSLASSMTFRGSVSLTAAQWDAVVRLLLAPASAKQIAWLEAQNYMPSGGEALVIHVQAMLNDRFVQAETRRRRTIADNV